MGRGVAVPCSRMCASKGEFIKESESAMPDVVEERMNEDLLTPQLCCTNEDEYAWSHQRPTVKNVRQPFLSYP